MVVAVGVVEDAREKGEGEGKAMARRDDEGIAEKERRERWTELNDCPRSMAMTRRVGPK